MGYQHLLMKHLLSALIKAKLAISNPVKDSKNPHFRNTYASLESVLDAVTGPLLANGIALVQTMKPTNDDTLLETILWHAESGESIVSIVALSPAKKDPQGYAAACTYYRRLSIKSMLGLAEVDDDGNEASQPQQQRKAPSAAAQKVMQKLGGELVDGPTLVGMIREAKDLAALNALAAKAKGLPEAEKAEAREAYSQRLAILEGK
jgi:ERF superfamily